MPLPPQKSSLEGRRLQGVSLTPQIINPDALAWSEQRAALSVEHASRAPNGAVLSSKRSSSEGGAAAIELVGLDNRTDGEGEGQAGVRAVLPPRLPQSRPSRRGASFATISSAGTTVAHMPTPVRPTAAPAAPAPRDAERYSVQPQGGDGSSDGGAASPAGQAATVSSTWCVRVRARSLALALARSGSQRAYAQRAAAVHAPTHSHTLPPSHRATRVVPLIIQDDARSGIAPGRGFEARERVCAAHRGSSRGSNAGGRARRGGGARPVRESLRMTVGATVPATDLEPSLVNVVIVIVLLVSTTRTYAGRSGSLPFHTTSRTALLLVASHDLELAR
jgi:hypothetical protein